MRILVVGSGGVGAAFAPIAARRDFYEHVVFADYDGGRAASVVDRYDAGTGRFSAAQVDASDASQIAELCRSQGITHDNEETWGRDGAQAVVWQTAINPVVALELLASGEWSGTGVLGPEAFAPDPFLDLLTAYGSPWGLEERTPAP